MFIRFAGIPKPDSGFLLKLPQKGTAICCIQEWYFVSASCRCNQFIANLYHIFGIHFRLTFQCAWNGFLLGLCLNKANKLKSNKQSIIDPAALHLPLRNGHVTIFLRQCAIHMMIE